MTKTEKGFILGGGDVNGIGGTMNMRGRAATVYNLANLITVSGTTKRGEMLTSRYVQPLFVMTREERIMLFQSCDPVQAVVTGRMNRIAGLNWHVVPEKELMDQIVQRSEDAWLLSREYNGPDVLDQLVRQRIFSFMRNGLNSMPKLPDLKADLSNFHGCLLRWKRRALSGQHDRAREIEDWLSTPAQGVKWSDFVKKYIFDLMVHGNAAIIKIAINDLLENFDTVLGGTIAPLQSPWAGGATLYAQVNPPTPVQIFGPEEISYRNYIPSSARAWGFIPLECLVNRLAEYLLFDRRMADQSDGTRPPDKVVIFGQPNPFGTIREGVDGDHELPLDDAEQKRLEQKINTARKEAIAVLTGYGTPEVVDMTRDYQAAIYKERQEAIIKSTAMVFGTTNNELNMSGGDDTSGRATAESQERIEQGKGIGPMVTILKEDLDCDIIPYRWGMGYRMEFQGGMTDDAELERYKKLLDTGASINDIMELQNRPRYDGEEFDKPFIAAQSTQQLKSIQDAFAGTPAE